MSSFSRRNPLLMGAPRICQEGLCTHIPRHAWCRPVREEQIAAAVEWLQDVAIRARLHYASPDSWTLAEQCGDDVGRYISTGALITALLREDYRVRSIPGTPVVLAGVRLLPAVPLRLRPRAA